MATRIITDLPVELLVMILFFLDAHGLINCKQHMRRTAELVPGTSFPQWTTLVWTTASGGLFAQANMRGGIEFIQFPSAVLGVSERRWSVCSDRLEMEMETMCMDPSQDVVVVTGWARDQVPNGPEGRYPALRILSITNGQSHPLAARSEINLSDTGRYDELGEVELTRREGRQSRLEGDYVAHLGSWNHEYAVLVWDWKTGDLLWESTYVVHHLQFEETSPENKYDSFDFVDSRHLLATDDSIIDIFVLDRPSKYTGVPTFIRGSHCIWEHPRRKGQSFTAPRLMSTHKGGCSPRNPAHPFYSSSQRGLVAVACYGAPPNGDIWTEVILVPASMIREWALRAQTGEATMRVGDAGIVDWADWAPHYPRMLRAGRPFSAEVQGMHATFANIEEEDLMLDHIDYTAVGGKEVEFDFKTSHDIGDEWDERGLCVVPEDSDGVHSAYTEAQPIDQSIPQYLVILPDYAILQEYEDDNGDNQWQIYHIVASDSDDSECVNGEEKAGAVIETTA
ncbi:hypothetical protein IEO21_03100 [Rhodonia placenta]|uniref:F-box domain-containing protein n=1 Tax=Rhodonia placenta TaxID=104341 RepID=A0A8H7U3S8_9APHY|nr:hypothetical protein IEO21_03100 [Postia placenta]